MSKRIRKLGLLACGAALALSLLGTAQAGAAVSLSVGPISHAHSHSADPVHRGDEYFTYSVTVQNTGSSKTSAPVNLHLSLPTGVVLDGIVPGTSSDWSCFLSANTCTYAPEEKEGALQVLKVGVFLDPALSADTVTASFAAFGGGASGGANNSYSFTQGSPLQFGLVGAEAGACEEAPVLNPPTTGVCQAADGGDPATQAGGHPFLASTTFGFQRKKVRPKFAVTFFPGEGERPFENMRDGAVNLPPGFVANPTVVAGGCTVEQVSKAVCPERFAVGRTWTELEGFLAGGQDQESGVFKIASERGYPARFAFKPIGPSPVTIVLKSKVRPGDGTVTGLIPTAPENPSLFGVNYFTLCSYGARVQQIVEFGAIRQASDGCKKPTDTGAFGVPFLTNPTRCNGEEDVTTIDVTSYQHPGRVDSEGFPDLTDPSWRTRGAKSPELTGCNQLPFDPSFQGRPTTNVADAPSGLDFDLDIPQDGLLEPGGIATAHLKEAMVELPEGMRVNPSSATGLAACSEAQMGLLELDHPGPFPIRFDGQPVQCPNGSRIGSVEVSSPLIDETVKGGVYLAEQDDPATTTPGAENPFDSTLAIYIAVRNDEIGVSAKLAGEVEADPVTGQLRTRFDQNPQLPFDHLRLRIKEGPRATLRTPSVCDADSSQPGSDPFTTLAEFASWSEQTPVVERVDSYGITTAPGGGFCATDPSELPNSTRLTAGTAAPKAGAYSPFVLRLSRDDGTQELKGLEATLPPGLTGRLAGVPYCPEAAIAQATARSRPGEGALEQSSPSCPAASGIGNVQVSAGAGPVPYRTAGKLYLAGHYKGGPISMVAVTPAVAGPFDLGTVVVRNAVYVNPVTAQVSVKSDPLPTILEGIPLDVRSIEARIDRDRFTLNPTNCEQMSIGASAQGVFSNALLSQRFQVGECEALGFKPKLNLRLHGGTKRADYQRLVATVTARPGDANIARAAVTFPHSIFLAQEHIDTVCTRVQFAADACPKGSIYGHATAITPLLDQPLSGPVYLRSSSNLLPDVVVALRGPDTQPIEVELAGRVDSKDGGIRNTFELVPDAPVSKFRLEMFGGDKSLLVSSRDLCKGPKQRATVRLSAHSGARHDFRPVVGTDCTKHGPGGKSKKGRGKGGKRSALAALVQAW